jgi:hypothetical protein
MPTTSDPTLSYHTRPNRAGLWYFVVVIITAGIFSAVPFAHAAKRLRRPSLWRLTGVYAAVGVVLITIIELTPPGPNSSGASNAISTISSLLMLGTTIVACIQLRPLRREVYGLDQHAGLPGPAATDPAVLAALAGRVRRQEARTLAARDPLLARELRIGRPDLARQYEDGGLVDLNTAPAHAIADVCELSPEDAEKIVSTRQLAGGSFSNIDELIVLVDLPPEAWDRVRDRGVLLTK